LVGRYVFHTNTNLFKQERAHRSAKPLITDADAGTEEATGEDGDGAGVAAEADDAAGAGVGAGTGSRGRGAGKRRGGGSGKNAGNKTKFMFTVSRVFLKKRLVPCRASGLWFHHCHCKVCDPEGCACL
jgi:hypothetical protein